MSKSVRLLFALILCVSMLLVACGEDSPGPSATPEDEPQETPVEDGGATLMITAFDFGFREEAPTVAAGEVALTFRNTGKAPHTFTIEDLDVDESAGGGESVESTFTAEAGTYKFECTIHPQMTGELVVE